MKILVLNCGSSSIKFQLFEMPENKVLVRGLIEKIGLQEGCVTITLPTGRQIGKRMHVADHRDGIHALLDVLVDPSVSIISSLDEIAAVGHRVVHGGESFSGSVLIDQRVINAMNVCTDLAPLHNPPNLAGIEAIRQLLPDIPQAGVFDTAFHQTIPRHAFLYGLPYELYEKYRIRRYGFHGTSHQYVSQRACDITGDDIRTMRIITCHLGNGSSMTAIREGVSVDTSMGMTPIEGLIMGTRCGDLDAGALLSIADRENLSIGQVSELINSKSGMLGISGVSSDMRDIGMAAQDGSDRARLSLQMYAYRVKKYIGAYAAAMEGIDMVVFTGGIGENDDKTREMILTGLECLGIDTDKEENKRLNGKEGVISSKGSRVKVLVVPTNEELVIAGETYRLLRTRGW